MSNEPTATRQPDGTVVVDVPGEETACERLARLIRVRDALASGGGVIETRFGDDMVRFGPGNLAELNRLIGHAQTACDIEMGTTKPRRRQARGVLFRPY